MVYTKRLSLHKDSKAASSKTVSLPFLELYATLFDSVIVTLEITNKSQTKQLYGVDHLSLIMSYHFRS